MHADMTKHGYGLLRRETPEGVWFEVYGREIPLGQGPSFMLEADAARCVTMMNQDLAKSNPMIGSAE